MALPTGMGSGTGSGIGSGLGPRAGSGIGIRALGGDTGAGADGAGGFEAAELVGLAPERDVADDAVRAAAREALARHGVLCIRLDRKLDKEEFRRVAGLLGPIKRPVARTRDGGLFDYDADRQVIDSGFVMTDELRRALAGRSHGALDDERPGLFETFHIDDSYTDEPASATVLHARALPPSGGGATVFLDLRAAYDRLDPAWKELLRGLRAVHAYCNDGAFPPRVPARGPAEVLAPVSHPLVRTHPVTGRRGLFFDLDRATHVEGMAVEEGRALLRSLQEHAERTAPRYAHAWRPCDVLVWDNASVQHKAGGDFPVGEPRRFWRHMIEGTRPV